MDHVVVDWSGARSGAAQRIWLGHVRAGRLFALRNGRTREHVIDHLLTLRTECPEGLMVGLDFSFSFPLWFLESQGYADISAVWDGVAHEGPQWLARCEPPFWGRPGRPKPSLPEHLRDAEKRLVAPGVHPKSVFQIGGAGTVGTGSIRGMPLLRLLRLGGFGIWPFDPPSAYQVVELYPRLMTGPVHKRNAMARANYLDACQWQLRPEHTQSMLKSEDAFDAGVSALVLAEQQPEAPHLPPSIDPQILLEGDIWPPSNIDP
jgi:hypothetical protein